MVMLRYIYFIIFAFLIDVPTFGQTADIFEGCVPLDVKFNAPVLSQYYWDFKDASFASEQSPIHTFTKAGVYEVVLKAGQNGNTVGTVTIKVYNDPTISLQVDTTEACVPLKVRFLANITNDPNIVITSYLWTFGDGNTATSENPSYTYISPGQYDVSLAVKSNLKGCETTFISPKLVETYGTKADFIIIPISECVAPFKYQLINKTIQKPGNTYAWDFGNGKTSTEYNGGIVTYTTNGSYRINLVVTDVNGCKDSLKYDLTTSGPAINISFIRDSVCIDELINMVNNTSNDNFVWTFDPSASIPNSTLRQPIWSYRSPGLKTVFLKVGNACTVDTSFKIYVEALTDASFTANPEIGCSNPLNIQVEANDKNLKIYSWKPLNIAGGPIETLVIKDVPRDSLYMHYKDTIYLSLIAESKLGCKGVTYDTVYYQRPDAYLLASPTQGCAPLEIIFTDQSYTHVPIKKIKWIFGDGSMVERSDVNPVKHTFNLPGEYYVRSIIENEAGCIDTSASTLITVGSLINSNYTIDKTEICLGDSVFINFLNNDPRIDAWHVSTDDGRYNHCWNQKSSSHRFITAPGTYPVRFTIDYNGCLNTVNAAENIKVKGSKANIGYMIQCDKPLELVLTNKSINDTEIEWQVEDSIVYTLQNPIHTFQKTGDYIVKLRAKNTADNCPESVDQQLIHIRQIKADFEIPKLTCDYDSIVFDASKSIDVDVECSKGYLWNYSFKRPLETNDTIHKLTIPAGKRTVQLVVEDTNGCRDTMTQAINSYGIYPVLEVKDLEVCYPATIDIKNLTTSDTSIVSWLWNTGRTTKNLVQEFKLFEEEKIISLSITDALGCGDNIAVRIKGYQPFSEVTILPQSTVCIGQPLFFNATDFTEKGSNLKFRWSFGDSGSSTLEDPTHTYLNAGNYNTRLIIEEVGSACKDTIFNTVSVIEKPKAAFTSNVDNLATICYPQTIQFTNTSVVNGGNPSYLWRFGNSLSILKDPTIALGKGIYLVQLTASSLVGCADSTSREFVLTGPEGDLFKSKDTICTNEMVELALINDVDVNSFKWQFGDGTSNENVSPIKKTFNPVDKLNYIPIDLILKSSESGCEYLIRDSIAFNQIIADFDILDTNACPGLWGFKNKTIGASIYKWDFGNGATSNDEEPSFLFDGAGNKTIQLIAISQNGLCQDTASISQELVIKEELVKVPNIFTPNGDNENDFFTLNLEDQKPETFRLLMFKVYNRWGQLVYEGNNAQGWDGNFKGQPAPAEVYAYYLEVEVADCTTYIRKGNITLVR